MRGFYVEKEGFVIFGGWLEWYLGRLPKCIFILILI